MQRLELEISLRTHGLEIAMTVVAVLSGACFFNTNTASCETSGLRCPPGWACTADQDACTQDGCGDGLVTGEEVCDDGNQQDGDGCSANCTDEICGNGTLEQGETCDDGNTVTGDGCDAACAMESCGNRILDPHEECDTGLKDSLGCNYPTDPAQRLIRCTFARCGDGYTNQAAGEECDLGGMITPACDGRCKKPVCGDRFYDPVAGEECDTGVDTQACNGKDSNVSDGDDSCKVPECGDGYTNVAYIPPWAAAPESCDTGGSSQTCDSDCTPPACGDDHWNPSFKPPGSSWTEECDDGNGDIDDGIANSDTAPNACRTNCRKAFCGDGVVDTHGPGPMDDEGCDDGAANSNTTPDACRTDCRRAFCGDGVNDRRGPGTADDETCDDGTACPGAGQCSTVTCICD